MRDEGIIRAWGIGVNTPLPILKVMEDADPDVCLCARQYSLVDHASAVNELFPVVRKKNVSLVIGSSLNAGFISGEHGCPEIAPPRVHPRGGQAYVDLGLLLAARPAPLFRAP